MRLREVLSLIYSDCSSSTMYIEVVAWLDILYRSNMILLINTMAHSSYQRCVFLYCPPYRTNLACWDSSNQHQDQASSARCVADHPLLVFVGVASLKNHQCAHPENST